MSDNLTRIQILPISYANAVIQNNAADVVVLEPGSSTIVLPPPGTQRKLLSFVNRSGGTVTIPAEALSIPNDNYLTLLGNYITNEWQVIQSGAAGDVSGWSPNGNSLISIGLLGTLNDVDFNIISNGVPQINISSTGINLNPDNAVGFSFTGVPTPVNLTDGLNKEYVDGTPASVTPSMSSNTTPTPYRVVENSAYDAAHQGWKAFRNIDSDINEWAVLGTIAGVLDFFYPDKMYIKSFAIRSSLTTYWDSWEIQGSNDGTTFTTLFSSATRVPNTKTTFNMTTPGYYTQYRFNGFAPTYSQPGLGILQYITNVQERGGSVSVITNLTDSPDPTSAPTKDFVSFKPVTVISGGGGVGSSLNQLGYRFGDAVFLSGTFVSDQSQAIYFNVPAGLRPAANSFAGFSAAANDREDRGLGFIWNSTSNKFENNFNAPAAINGTWAFSTFWKVEG